MEVNDQQVVTVSFARYEGWSDRWQAFRQMGLAPRALRDTPGLQFAKMLGSGGRNGFGIWPNWGVYGLLGVWQDEGAAKSFFDEDPVFFNLTRRAKEVWTVFMRACLTHGAWDGVSPFVVNAERDDEGPVGVITRATIRARHLWRFWRFVPPVSRSVEGREGLLFAVGIGELPLIQQATFSLWRNARLMEAYAYRSPYHREVVKRTRELGWYKEELFARFKPYAASGSWYGSDPLAPYLGPDN